MNPADTMARHRLRRQLRAVRDALSTGARRRAAILITGRLALEPWLQRGHRVGLYQSFGSEVATAPLLQLARRRGCVLYLPRITSYQERRMRFCAWRGLMRPNRYGIDEPVVAPGIDVRRLNVVLMPLLGFDALGHRIGSGAGYYDRLLAWRHETLAGGPLLIGLAYRCQQVASVPAAAHDVGLDAVVTEAGWIHFNRG